jgi:hypothetical protein
MATKSRKKSSRKTSRKTARKSVQVELDPATVNRFESHLREGLVASGAVLMSTETPKLKPNARVELDSETTIQLAKILRDGLISSGAVLATEYPELKESAAKPKATRKGKKYPSK